MGSRGVEFSNIWHNDEKTKTVAQKNIKYVKVRVLSGGREREGIFYGL